MPPNGSVYGAGAYGSGLYGGVSPLLPTGAAPLTLAVPHLAIPFRFDVSGSAVVLAQDSLDEITQCVQILLSTPLGSREVTSDYGIPDPTFVGADPAAITVAVATWEPRAAVTVTPNPTQPGSVTVTVAQVDL
jgi:phage baseplate assembly protein W